ncbi:hypothetical protein ES708_00030 [subsurface metagenome]
MPQEIGFGTPGTEEMTAVVAAAVGAGITGVVEGVVVKMAPELGAADPILKWGALIGVPALGVAGALFTRGLLGNLFTGIAAGGLGVVGYVLPEMLAPLTERRAPAQLGGGGSVKQLPAGAQFAPQRAQSMARVGLEF